MITRQSGRLRPVYFQHLSKTAGTSLADSLRLFFSPDRMATSEEIFTGDGSLEHALAKLNACDFVTGHGEILSDAPADAFKVSIFRDPFRRLLSERRQWMQAGPNDIAGAAPEVAAATVALQKRSLVDILGRVFDYPVMVPGYWNHQTTALGVWPILKAERRVSHASAYRLRNMHEHFGSGSELRAWLFDNKARIARGARQALASLDYVGLTEDFETSVREIFARIGLPEPREILFRNVRSAFDDEDDPAINEPAKDFLELDNELYEAAAERHATFGRIARGAPADYIGRRLSATTTSIVSSGEAPGGHGWYLRHLRPEGPWARWTGPGRESRFAAAAPAGTYVLTIEIYGATSEQTLREMQIEIDGQTLATEVAYLPSTMWSAVTTFVRDREGHFEIVLHFPTLAVDHGICVKQFTFVPSASYPAWQMPQ